MLKHCHNSSLRLSRKCVNGNPDTVSINSTMTLQSTSGSSESNTSDSSLNSSFNMNNIEPADFYTARNSNLNRGAFVNTPEPISLSSRASSLNSLAEVGPKTVLKIYASCLRPDIEYKTLSVGATTSAKEIIWQLLSKFKMKHRDPKLFYLTMEVELQKTGREGVSRRTLVLEDDARLAELKNCNPWGECKFSLQMRKGGLIRVYDSVLMQESQYKCLLISDETTVEDVVKILLHCYGLERIERAERYCMYEQCSSQRYQRKLENEDRPLAVQDHWSGPTEFSFVLRHYVGSIEGCKPSVQYPKQTRPIPAERTLIPSSTDIKVEALIHRSWSKEPAVPGDSVLWRDKETEDVLSDMDTSLSSSSSPTPPITSTPLSSVSSVGSIAYREGRLRPPSFLYSSSSCESFTSGAPAAAARRPPTVSPRPSVSSPSLASRPQPSRSPPALPPKPPSLAALFARPNNHNVSHDYENYFYI